MTQSSYTPDLSASTVTEKDGKTVWTKYFMVDAIAEGYFKGLDNEGQTIIVQTREAKDIQRGIDPATPTKRGPDLYIYREEDDEDCIVWTELFVAWKGKKDGYFTAKDEDGLSIVLQTKAAREMALNQRPRKQVAPIILEAVNPPETT